MGDQSLRAAVEGMTPPEKEKHQFFLDVQPVSTITIVCIVDVNTCSPHAQPLARKMT